jgi:hypothetical protein
MYFVTVFCVTINKQKKLLILLRDEIYDFKEKDRVEKSVLKEKRKIRK